jgi:hypothetical protein
LRPHSNHIPPAVALAQDVLREESAERLLRHRIFANWSSASMAAFIAALFASSVLPVSPPNRAKCWSTAGRKCFAALPKRRYCTLECRLLGRRHNMPEGRDRGVMPFRLAMHDGVRVLHVKLCDCRQEGGAECECQLKVHHCIDNPQDIRRRRFSGSRRSNSNRLATDIYLDVECEKTARVAARRSAWVARVVVDVIQAERCDMVGADVLYPYTLRRDAFYTPIVIQPGQF